MKELSVGEQRYKAVMAVLGGGRTVTEVARDWDVSRQTMHAWLARYEREGMEWIGDRSHRPTHCPHQRPALIEVAVLEMRRHKPFWGRSDLYPTFLRPRFACAPARAQFSFRGSQLRSGCYPQQCCSDICGD